jgi:hypothetical protein
MLLFERARELIGGSFNSVYRSPRVNALVDGSKNSRHLRGLATDIRPAAGLTPRQAADKIFARAKNGELPRVQQVIAEPTWVHVGYFGLGEDVKAPALLTYDGTKYERVA